MRSLFTGVSGLKQNQTRMDVLSNNIANVNTTGFKRGRALFQDLFSQTIRNSQQAFGSYGGLNPMQVGLGAQLGSIDTLMDQGTLETTGKNTDLAIEGNGFFAVENGNGVTQYTRDGNFSVNPNYDLVSANTGYKLQGWLSTQNAVTGNLELNDTGTVPYDINIVKYLKKFAHQTNTVTYASNLDSSADERDVKMGEDTLTFKDSNGSYQNLQFKFKKLDATNWVWSATDDSEGNVASGTFKTDETGKLIESTVEPAGQNSTAGLPYFTYDPDGTPAPATATTLVNALTNSGGGTSSGVVASGTEVKDETVSVIFDGGDPTRATSFRVVGSERGYIGSGLLGGTQAKLEGTTVTFGTTWTPTTDTSFTVSDLQFNPPRQANVAFTAGQSYTTSEITDAINTAASQSGLRITAFYDSVLNQFSVVSNETGSNQSISISNAVGSISDLGLPATTSTGTGGSKPEVFSSIDLSGDTWDPTGDVSFTVSDSEGRSALIQFDDVVAGQNQVYSRSAIISTINSALASNNVSATVNIVDTNGDATSTPDQLVITGSQSGSGELITISGDDSMSQLGLTADTYRGTAAVATFNQGGLNFSLTEGTNAWLPNDSMTMTTTAEKGQADAVSIYVPQPNVDTLTFQTTVGGETYDITGAINKGAVHSTSINVYDSLGAAHELNTEWESTNKETKEWTYKVSYSKDDSEITNWLSDPANGVASPSDPTTDDLERANDALLKNRKGTIYFSNNGKIDATKSLISAVEATPKGSNPIKIALDMDLVTQFDSSFTTAARDQDGYEMGVLESMYFEADGTIRGVYSNGQKQPIGAVALATFNNPGGLEKSGENLYDTSPNSGMAVVGRPSSGGRGDISAGALEMSNVDIAEEFTNMIVAQRAFQANSRVITTSDEMLQEVVNLKR